MLRHSNPTKNKVWWPRQTKHLVGFGLRFFTGFLCVYDFLVPLHSCCTFLDRSIQSLSCPVQDKRGCAPFGRYAKGFAENYSCCKYTRRVIYMNTHTVYMLIKPAIKCGTPLFGISPIFVFVFAACRFQNRSLIFSVSLYTVYIYSHQRC